MRSCRLVHLGQWNTRRLLMTGNEWHSHICPLGVLLATQSKSFSPIAHRQSLCSVKSLVRVELKVWKCVYHCPAESILCSFCRCRSVTTDLFKGQKDHLKHHGRRSDSFVILVQQILISSSVIWMSLMVAGGDSKSCFYSPCAVRVQEAVDGCRKLWLQDEHIGWHGWGRRVKWVQVYIHIKQSTQKSTQSSQNRTLPQAVPDRCVRAMCVFQRREMESRAAGVPRLWVNTDGWGRQLKGITSKALGAEEQTLCRSANCWRWRGSRQDEELDGMLTIMIASANPGMSRPPLPHSETGYYLPPTGSDILPHTANQRGDRGHFLRAVPVLEKHQNGRRGDCTRWRGVFLVELGFSCRVRFVTRGLSVRWIGVCEARQSQS